MGWIKVRGVQSERMYDIWDRWDVLGRGSALYPAITDGEVHSIRLTDVWYVPNMNYNLLSIICLKDKGC